MPDVALLLSLFFPPPPHPVELLHFPPAAACKPAREFARAARCHLEARQAQDPQRYWEYQEQIQEAGHAYAAWDLLLDAHTAYEAGDRRAAQRRLRELLGEDYFSGRMPGPALWAFREVGR